MSTLAGMSVRILEKLMKLLVLRITGNSGFSEAELKAAQENLSDEDFHIVLAILDYILRSFRYNVDDDTLSNELLQIGFSQDHVSIITRFTEH